MLRRRWFLAQIGAGLNVCLLTGCIFTSAEKNDPQLVRDPVLIPRETVAPAYPNREVVARELEAEASERPLPPPEPVTELQPHRAIVPPVVVAPVPPPQPPQPPPDPPAITALRAYLDNKPDSAGAVLQQLLPVVASASLEEMDGGPKSAALVKERLDLLTDTLRPRPTLTLSKVCFTRNIEGFGRYDPLPADADCPHFQSGIDGRPGDRIQLYVEVRNFVNRKVGTCWETALSSTLEIRSLDIVERNPGVQLKRPARPDRSLSPRQDYSLGIEFHVPPKLPPGRYELKIRVCDELAAPGKVARSDSSTAAPTNEHILTFWVEPAR